jgi:hypothetical protein
MTKKSLLFTLLAALFMPWAANAQTTVTIGDGTSSNYYTPIGTYYNYSITEQLYTADEIGMAGTISSIGFYYAGTAAKDFPITVYMTNVDADDLSTGISLADADVVFEGTYSVTGAGWATIELNTPFAYDGTSSLLIGINKSYLEWYGNGNWNHTATEAVMARYSNNDNSAYTTTAVPASTTTSRPNIQMVITASGTPVCLKPTLAVPEIIHNQATLTIGGGSGTYNVQYKLATETTWTNVASNSTNTTFTLSGLTPLTAYDVQAQSVCDGGATSDWKTASFSTTAQAEIVGNAWSDDFEGETCGWELINGTCTNAWVWGTATSNGGTHALYISNDGGTTNAYNYGLAAMVYATKLLNFTEGKFEFGFNWIANGESSYDFLRVALVPASVTLTAGTSLPSGFNYNSLPSGWIALDGGSKLNLANEWQSKSVAVNVTAGNYYLVMAWRDDTSGGTNPPAAVDNVSITRIACGYDVEGLTVDNVTTNSAILTWTAGEAEQWQVAFADNGNFDNATEAIVSAATYNMTGLQPSTRYYAKVRAYCGGEDFGSWSSVFDFFTDCAIIPAVGYTENFDNYTAAAGVLPICWNKINTTTYSSYQGYPRIYNYTYQSSPNCLYFYSYYSSSYDYYDPQDQYAILPEMENLAGKLITLSARANSNTVTFKIGLMTDPTDATTFTEIATQALTTSYQEFEYLVPDNATAHYIAIMMEAASSSSSTRYVFIDDIAITEAPTCFKPTGLTYSKVYGHGATLSWLLNDETQTAWDVQVSDTVSFSRIVALVENVNNHENYVLSGLDPETHYYVRVRANCGDGDVSDWSNTVNFTTTVACPAPTGFAASEISGYTATLNWDGYNENYTVSYRTAATAIGFFEAFNTSGIPTGWTQYSGLVDGVLADTIELTSGSNWGTSSYGLGAYNAKLNIYGTSRKNWLVTPEVTLESGYNLDFDLALTDYGNSNPIEHDTLQADDRFVVLIYADETWTILREWNNTGSEYVYNTIATTGEHVSINLSAYVGKTVKIAFYGESTAEGGDNDMHIDNVCIGVPVPAGQWQTVTVDEAPVILTDLTPKTYYDAKVQGNCGDDGLSLESSVITFTTLDACPTPTGLAAANVTATTADLSWNGSIDVDSYTVQYRTAAHEVASFMQNFESETALDGWTFIGDSINGIDATGTYHAELHTTAAHSGSYGFRFSSYNRSEDYNQYLISPELTVTGELKFYYKRYSSGTGEVFRVGYSTTNEVETFTWGDTIHATTSWQAYTQELPADAKYFAIHYFTNYQYYLYVDDITIGAHEVPVGEWQTASSTTNNVTLTGLTPETPYEVQVKSDCSDPETWSNIVTFTTLEATTITLTINGYLDDTNEGGYYLIASPVIDEITPSADNGFIAETTENYDLYYFDQVGDDEGNEWINFKDENHGNFNLINGKGYLYASKEGTTLTFTGTPYSGNGTIELIYDDNATDFKGWNLVGNPYNYNVSVDKDFYIMNEDGMEIISADENTPILPMQGFFVVATEAEQTVTFSEWVAPIVPLDKLVMNLTNKRGATIDRAIVRFGEGRQLPKFQLNKNHTKVYIPQDGKDYAIVNVGRDAMNCVSTEIPVNFKAEKNGTYTLTVSESLNSKLTTLNASHFLILNLIDNLTGIETDLLANPSYSFEAKTTDYESRFKLVFRVDEDNQNSNDNFAFFHNGELIVNGEGTLQIFDVLGHEILCRHLSPFTSHLSPFTSPGVYVLRLIDGQNVRTQKIVID